MFTSHSVNPTAVNACETCSRQEHCYGLKIDAILMLYPRSVDVVEEKDISRLKRFVGDLEEVCLMKGEGLPEINSILRSYSR